VSDEGNYLGEQLVRSKVITREQLQKALEVQAERAKLGEKTHLGGIIKELGFSSEEKISRALAKQHNVPYVDVDNLEISENVLSLIPRNKANRHKVFPIKQEKGALVVAMMYPENEEALADLRATTGKDIQPVLIKDGELEKLLRKVNKKLNEEIESFEFFKQSKQKKALDRKNLDLSPDRNSGNPAVDILNKLLDLAVQEQANDLHIEPQIDGVKIRFRIDGILHKKFTIDRDYHEGLVTRIKVLANMDITDNRTPQDGRMSIEKDGETIDVRVATLPAHYGERVTLRLLFHEEGLMDLANLGFTNQQLERIKELINHPYGFMVVSGPTGSGKSTTLYAALSEMNTDHKNIITVEDPIEKKIKGINQIQYNEKQGVTFARGLRAMLRNHPDVIMVGEIRDVETGNMSTQAALTGHLVMSTIHAGDASRAVIHFLDMGVEPYLVESSLTGVISQRLMRKLCQNCKVKSRVNVKKLLKFIPDFPVNEGETALELFKAKGCAVCDYSGYRGRTGVYEILMASDKIRNAIRGSKSSHVIQKIAVSEGMAPLRYNALQKVKNAITSLEEFKRVFM